MIKSQQAKSGSAKIDNISTMAERFAFFPPMGERTRREKPWILGRSSNELILAGPLFPKNSETLQEPKEAEFRSCFAFSKDDVGH
jgi:hypothetical protein